MSQLRGSLRLWTSAVVTTCTTDGQLPEFQSNVLYLQLGHNYLQHFMADCLKYRDADKSLARSD